MNSKFKVFLFLALSLAVVVGSHCQTISFNQLVPFNPNNGAKVFRTYTAPNSFVQFQITQKPGRNHNRFTFTLRQLPENPFPTAPLPLNDQVLGLFQFEVLIGVPTNPFKGTVSMRYQPTQLVNSANSVSAIIYDPVTNTWNRRGHLSTPPYSLDKVNPSATVNNSDFTTSSNLFFGFIENNEAAQIAAASSWVRMTVVKCGALAIVSMCLTLFLLL